MLVNAKYYQLLRFLEEEGISESSTLGSLLTLVQTGKTNTCPQCGNTGTIDTDGDSIKDDVCPTCEGDGKTTNVKVIDRANSTLVYIDAE